MTRCLVTGANGFVGLALVERLHRMPDITVSAAVRRPDAAFSADLRVHSDCQLDPPGGWPRALEGQDCVVHAAARVHVMHDAGAEASAAYHRTNVLGTLHLARAAALAGVGRFVYLSSIKVNGEATAAGRPFRADDAPAPLDAYGRSKLQAEQALQELSSSTGMALVIVRPPLVYGPGVRANFRSLIVAVARGVPLPFGCVRNARSLVGLDNLVDLLAMCTTHPAAGGQTLLVSDGEDLSTPELVRRLARALGRSARLLPVPVGLLRAAAAIAGRRDAMQRLCSSLQIDATPTRRVLGWAPPLSVDEGLERTVAAFLAAASHQQRTRVAP
jgi:UDP-4-keto-D-QuiNAc 4-reductase